MNRTIQGIADEDLNNKSDKLFKDLELSRKDQKYGRFKDADDVVAEMREKYDL